MTTIHLISHTHWDREWYLTFQQFRLKLIHLMDNLLELLEKDPDFKFFTLDGQTIILDDYLYMRPERQAEIRALIQSGQLLIGPWHILPDEFLVSPEAIIRNLLQGERTSRQFGAKMNVGYIPDPFGHIGQLPQILRGFGIESASVQRGLSDEPCEFWWSAPDGSRVFMAYLRDGYGNAAGLPTSNQGNFLNQVKALRDSLLPHTQTGHVLLMHGTDHMEPPGDTSAAIRYAREHLDNSTLIHSTLPNFIDAVKAQNTNQNLPTIIGELRSPRRSHLLPGVLSTRIWIKQRNHQCETLLEKWAEPFSTWASLLEKSQHDKAIKQLTSIVRDQPSTIRHPAPVLRQAWRLLMECHPHDSICGCSIDQVHQEMRPRFDQVEQIGEEITRQSLETIASAIDTRSHPNEYQSAIVVFNPTNDLATDLISVKVEQSADLQGLEIVDDNGKILPHQLSGSGSRELINFTLDRNGFKNAIAMVHDGRVAGMVIRDFSAQRYKNTVLIDAVLANTDEPDMRAWKRGTDQIAAFLADPTLTTYIVRARSASDSTIQFVASDVPGFGYKTYRLRLAPKPERLPSKSPQVNRLVKLFFPLIDRLTRQPFLEKWLSQRDSRVTNKPPFRIENDFFIVEASPHDGTLNVIDKRNGVRYQGLNRFIDGGDCGDEYNYCPPIQDHMISPIPKNVIVHRNGIRQTLEISLDIQTHAGLSTDRQSRSSRKVTTPISTRVSLVSGVPRIDIHTSIHNTALDHRLRVHFPAPFRTNHADYDGHFEVVRRTIGLPDFDDTWVEQPRPEVPQRAYTRISSDIGSLTIANRGLPEVEVFHNHEGNTEIALTLLRCVGWLSRDDFFTRKGHAGPMIATPGAQEQGEYTFEYSIIPHAVESRVSPSQLAYAFNAPLRAVEVAIQEGSLQPSGALIHVQPGTFVISAIKISDDDRGWIVRGYNNTSESAKVTLTPGVLISKVELVNLAEITQEELSLSDNGSVTFMARGHEIVSPRFLP